MSVDTVLDVDGCSDMFSLSKIFPSDLIGTCNEKELTSVVEGCKWIPVPKCTGVLGGISSTISSIEINLGGRGRPSGPKYIFGAEEGIDSAVTDVGGVTPSESAPGGAVSGIEVSTVTLGSVIMSSYNCGTSSVKVDVPEIIGVTVVSDDVETQVSNKSGEFNSIK